MFSLAVPLLLLALLRRLFAVIADENIFNLLYGIESVAGERERRAESGREDAYFLLTQRAALAHATPGVVKWQLPSSSSHMCVGVCA